MLLKVVGTGSSDHAKYEIEYEKVGIPVFKPYDNFKPLVQYESFTGGRGIST